MKKYKMLKPDYPVLLFMNNLNVDERAWKVNVENDGNRVANKQQCFKMFKIEHQEAQKSSVDNNKCKNGSLKNDMNMNVLLVNGLFEATRLNELFINN